MEIYAVRILDISEEMLDKLYLLIPLEKKCKIQKFINKKDKVRTIIGEIFIKTIITEKLEIRNKYIKFDKNEYGKPYLKGYPKFNFNIAHSGDYVLCAIDDKAIGIDIEEVKNIDYKNIAKSFFTISEYHYIIKNDSHGCLNKFYEIWTLKESYIKCCGQGLSIPLKSFSIDMDKHGDINLITDSGYSSLMLKKFDIDSHYKIAICSAGKGISNNIIIINQNELINNYLNLM